MGVGGDYSSPVYVNGYQCWNCTQVDEAKKGVDPADPKAGPYGIYADNPGLPQATPGRSASPAARDGLGGRLDMSV
jgi:hypothetical protein